MRIRTVVLGLLAAAATGASYNGRLCESVAAPANPPALAVPTVARLHWIGKKGLAARADAAGLMKLWNLPQSARLEGQTLDKLAAALAASPAIKPGPAGNPRSSASQLRPLLEDLLNRESFIEIRQDGAQPCELAFVVRLDPQRASVWETSLGAALKTIPGAAESTQGALRVWTVPRRGDGAAGALRMALTRSGSWTLLVLGPDPKRLLAEFSARIAGGRSPFEISGTNTWLETDFNPRGLATLLGLHCPLPQDLAGVSLSVTGDGATVIEHARLDFSQPLDLKLEPWKLPTSLVGGQVTSFTAVRGFEHWLGSLKAWRDLDIGGPPDQACFWSLRGLPMLSFLAAPEADANAEVSRLSELVLQKGGPWFATNPLAKFEKAKDFNGLDWKGIPFTSPFLRSAKSGNDAFLFAGLFPSPRGTNGGVPLPADLVKQLETHEPLVAYSWELTALRVEALARVAQTFRLVARRAQMPATSASSAWLTAIGPKLWPSVTEVTQTSPSQLSFKRRSSLGLTGLELHLLGEWLESPVFPYGLYTLMTPVPAVVSAPAPAARKPAAAPPARPGTGPRHG